MNGTTVCASARWLARWWVIGVGAALVAFAIKPHAATFTYTNPNCVSFTVAGSPPTQTVTCVTSGGGGSVPACSPSANPANPSVGQQVVISANCTNQPTTYTWTGGGCGATNGPTCTVSSKSKSGTVVFTVNATNASGMGPTAQLSVTWK